MNFSDKLNEIIVKNDSLLCVGLDPEQSKIPHHLKNSAYSLFEFNKAIIDATSDLAASYKPNSAFYEALGNKGIVELKMTCDYIKHKFPDMPIILDAKRADIGNTNEGYIKYAFEYLGADAITLNPYLGQEALSSFLKLEDKGCIILCKTSNRGAGEFQDLMVEGEPLYLKVAKKVYSDWNKNKNCLLVAGATYPNELKAIREAAGDMFLLVPGIGAQGGDIEKTIKAGIRSDKSGLIISASRSILYASGGEDFADKAREEAQKLRDEINKYRA